MSNLLSKEKLFELNALMKPFYNEIDSKTIAYTYAGVPLHKEDYYLINCTLCNYVNNNNDSNNINYSNNIVLSQLQSYKSQLLETRLHLFNLINGVSAIHYNQTSTEKETTSQLQKYKPLHSSAKQPYALYNENKTTGVSKNSNRPQRQQKVQSMCTFTGTINKYGHYEFEIVNYFDDIQKLWNFKDKNCIKYIRKQNDGNIIVSVAHYQLNNFVKDMLPSLNIAIVRSHLEDTNKKEPIIFDNNSNVTLLDLNNLDLKFEPYDFQIEDAKLAVSKKRVLLGHEMGCGKTFISILIGESLTDVKKLVICPESLRLNWRKEILQVNPNIKVAVLKASDDYDTIVEDDTTWLICGYITAYKFLDKLQHDFKNQCCIIDEVHNCKATRLGQPSSNRAKVAISMSNIVEYLYILTGTPMPSRNVDLYNIFYMLRNDVIDFNNPGAFFKYGTKFCSLIRNVFGIDVSGNSNSYRLHEALSKSMIRRLRKDVLPDLKKQRKFIPLAPKLTKEYKDIEYRLYYPNENDMFLGLAMTGRKLLSELKLKAAIELAESFVNAEESVVIVTNFVNTADAIKKHFGNKCCEIRGGMNDVAKQKAIDDFQSKKVQVCVLNMVAGGVGVTLTASHNMIVMDYDWTPAINVQTEDRICRIGQTELAMIHYLYCENSIFDRVFVEMLSDKSENIALVVDNTNSDYNLLEEKEKNSTYISKLKEEIKATKASIKQKKTKKKVNSKAIVNDNTSTDRIEMKAATAV